MVNLLDLSSSASWKYPLTASSLQNSFASGGIASIISLVDGKGVCGPLNELVQGSEVHDEAHAFPVCLGDEEGRAAPHCGFVDLSDHFTFDQFSYGLFRLAQSV